MLIISLATISNINIYKRYTTHEHLVRGWYFYNYIPNSGLIVKSYDDRYLNYYLLLAIRITMAIIETTRMIELT